MQRPHHFAIVPLIAVLIGCGAQPALDDNAGPSTQATDDSSQEQAVSSQEATEIELQMVSASDLTDQLAARKGQVVLLDMWATW